MLVDPTMQSLDKSETNPLALFKIEPVALKTFACILSWDIPDEFEIYHDISFLDYLKRITTYIKSPQSLILAVALMIKFTSVKNDTQYVRQHLYQTFLAAITVATKFLEDRHPRNTYFAELGGVTVPELNELELNFLSVLNWDVNVDLGTLSTYVYSIPGHARECSRCLMSVKQNNGEPAPGPLYKVDKPTCLVICCLLTNQISTKPEVLTELNRMPFVVYLSRIETTIRSPTSFLLAVPLMAKFISLKKDKQCCIRYFYHFFLTAVTVAMKLVEDCHPKNKDLANIGGITVQELNALELHFLKVLKWDTRVEQSQLHSYIYSFSEHFRVCQLCASESQIQKIANNV
jgi:hypothetical protein